jgi:hypothetical protein
MSTWNELIDIAFLDIAVIQPGESITTAMRTDAQKRLNELLASLSTEGATVATQKVYTGTLGVGTSNYTVGATGTLPGVNERVQRLTAWKAVSGHVAHGGPVLPLDAFGAAVQAEQERLAAVAMQAALAGIAAVPASIVAPVPSIVGADTAFPLINLKVFPPPSAASSLELAGWTPIAVITDFTLTPTLASGWELMIHTQLALLLYPMYARQGGIPQELAAMAMNAKASIVNQNTAGQPTGGAA